MLARISDMRKFVELVDSNASAKLYKRLLDMSPSDMRSHIGNLKYYRVYIELGDKVRILQSKRREAATQEQKDAVMVELRALQEEYKPKIMEAKGILNE
jgi:KaiC/GvpD/RAD55 family RecA-like ATPase